MTVWRSPDRTGPRSQYRALLASFAFANLADGFTAITLPLLAAAASRSALQVSLVAAARTLPWAVLAPPFGVFADRLALRRVLHAGNLLRAVSLALLALASVGGRLNVGVLAAGALLVGIGETVYDISAQTALPSLVPVGELERANSQQAVITEVLRWLIGPSLGGLILAAGAGWSLSASAALYIMAAVAALRLPPLSAVPRERSRFLAEMAAGLRSILRHPLLRALLLTTACGALAFAGWQPLFALFATGRSGPVRLSSFQFGLVYSCSALGGVASSVAAPRLLRRVSRAHLLVVANTVSSACLLLPILTPGFIVSGASLAGYSACVIVWNVIAVSYRQRALPGWLLGRTNAFYRALAWGLLPLGPMLGGLIGNLAHNTRDGLLALALLPVLAGVFAPVIYRHRRSLEMVESPKSVAP